MTSVSNLHFFDVTLILIEFPTTDTYSRPAKSQHTTIMTYKIPVRIWETLLIDGLLLLHRGVQFHASQLPKIVTVNLGMKAGSWCIGSCIGQPYSPLLSTILAQIERPPSIVCF